MTTPSDVRAVAAEAAGQLRRVLDAVEGGDLAAEPDQVAYLRGAAEALILRCEP